MHVAVAQCVRSPMRHFSAKQTKYQCDQRWPAWNERANGMCKRKICTKPRHTTHTVTANRFASYSDNLISLWSKVILTETGKWKKKQLILCWLQFSEFALRRSPYDPQRAHTHTCAGRKWVSYVSVSAINTYLLRTSDIRSPSRVSESEYTQREWERASETWIGKGCVDRAGQ